jgi:serine/threonine protein kinase
VIGRGAFGVVVLIDAGKGPRIARKIFSPGAHAKNDERETLRHRRRFVDEANLLKGFTHPNVVRVLDAQLDVDPLFFDMPFAETTLRRRIQRDQQTEQANILPIIDVLAGLEALHSIPIIHGDLKPENILLVESEWQVADLGLAGKLGITGGSVASGRIVGSNLYTAPERVRSQYAAGIPSDIFSLGCILHDILGVGDTREPHRQCSVPGPYGPVVRDATEEDESVRIQSVWSLRDSIGGVTDAPQLRELPVELLERVQLFRHRKGRFDRQDVRLIMDALERASEPSLRAALLFSVGERTFAQIEDEYPVLWRRIGLATCRVSRELGPSLSAISADRLASRLVHFCSYRDSSLSAAATAALLSLADQSRRASAAWWATRSLKPDNSQVVDRLLLALPQQSKAWRAPARLAREVLLHGEALDPRVREYFEQLATVAASAA